MENKDQELIERYCCNELPAAERAAFEQRLSMDHAFRQEVEAFEKAIRYVQLDGRKALQSRLAERGRQLDAEKKSTFFDRRWGWAIGVLAVAALFYWLFDQNKTPAPQTAPGNAIQQDSLKKMAPALPDSAGQQSSPPTPETTPPTAESKPENGQRAQADRLFAAYFQPYKDESLEPSVRGEGDATPEEVFLQNYWDGRHRAALAAFEKLEPASKNKGDLQFLQANCLLATGKAKAAIAVLENLGRTRFSAEAKWLLALAFLKNREMERAKAQLREMAGDAASVRRGEAARLLEALE